MFRGDKLKKLREVMGWSTTDVERMTGVRQSGISELENGITKNPRPETVKRICQGLRVNEDFFYIEDSRLPSELMPDMPPETLKYIMSGDAVPYLIITEKAKREGIPPEVLEKILELWKMNR